jgi:three-Cys-motif partner protein
VRRSNSDGVPNVRRDTLWAITRPTEAKHTILRKYLDAWLPILGAGRHAHRDIVLVDGFAGPGRYSRGEPGSPLIMLDAFTSHSATIRATVHFFFIEKRHDRYEYLRGEVAKLTLRPKEIQIIEGSFSEEFPTLVERLKLQFGHLPPTFAFIDPFGADEIPVAISTPLLEIPRCEMLIYFPVSFLARFAKQPEFKPILDGLYNGENWKVALTAPHFEALKQALHDMFLAELRKRVRWVRSFEITPAAESGGNTYYLFFGTGSSLAIRRMKYAMWKVDPASGEAFRDSTLADHPVLFEPQPDYGRLREMLRERFGTQWFAMKTAEEFTLFETAFRDDAHLKPTLKQAEVDKELNVRRPAGKRAGSFASGTRLQFVR